MVQWDSESYRVTEVTGEKKFKNKRPPKYQGKNLLLSQRMRRLHNYTKSVVTKMNEKRDWLLQCHSSWVASSKRWAAVAVPEASTNPAKRSTRGRPSAANRYSPWRRRSSRPSISRAQNALSLPTPSACPSHKSRYNTPRQFDTIKSARREVPPAAPRPFLHHVCQSERVQKNRDFHISHPPRI